MLSINAFIVSGPISAHTIANRSANARCTTSGPPGRSGVSGKRRNNSFLRTAHKCSIGFISGELGGGFHYDKSLLLKIILSDMCRMSWRIVLLKYCIENSVLRKCLYNERDKMFLKKLNICLSCLYTVKSDQGTLETPRKTSPEHERHHISYS